MSHAAIRRLQCAALTVTFLLFMAGRIAAGQSLAALAALAAPAAQPATVHLVVDAGRPLRLALDQTIKVKQVGQPVTATLAEPVYAYDRVVLPAGTKATGQITALERAPKSARVMGALAGDFSVPRRVDVRFAELVLPDGRTISIRTPGVEGVPSRMTKRQRLKAWAMATLPVHPQFLHKGTIFSARLESGLDFGEVTPTELAPAGIAPAPDSVLNARLLTPVDSATAHAGSPIEAVLSQPVFSADKHLILPEGTTLTGQVTFARPARRFHRHGQLRFLLDTVHQSETSRTLLAALRAVDSGATRVVIDEEGGATLTSSRARFVAPTLSALAVAGAMHGRLDYDTDGLPPEMAYGGVTSNYLGGFIGAGALGAGLSQLSRPVMIGITVAGLARTTYSTVFGRGRNVVFPVDTAMQLQLAPSAVKKS